jgi:aryl-alcohol dehydrogenase-like predicted oxidoreductase
MAMTLRLTEQQTEALRRRAAEEHRSMQQVALAAIDAYVQQPAVLPGRRTAVSVSELLESFGSLPPMDTAAFRADQDRHLDSDARFDAYERARKLESDE